MYQKWPFRRWWEIFQVFRPFAWQHRRWFAKGMLAAIFVVAIRLFLPWPFKAVIKPWFDGARPGLADIGIDSIVLMGSLFLLLFLGLGLADLLQRLYFARFAIATVRDIRAEALKKVFQINPRERTGECGNLISCLIGDTARMKTGLKGFFVHVTTNGVMLFGGCVVLLWINPALGLIFAGGGLAIGLGILWGTSYLFQTASKYRDKEGVLADYVYRAWNGKGTTEAFSGINYSSGTHEALATKIQGLATWFSHGVLGLVILLALWIGMREVAAGRLDAGDLLLFLLYALVMRSPIIQLTRQGTRTGKILACGNRLEKFLHSGNLDEQSMSILPPLQSGIHLIDAKVATAKSQSGHRRKIGPLDLEIPARKNIAIIGKMGAGKTTLLEVIARECKIKQGKILWDGLDLGQIPVPVASRQISYLSHSPTWGRCKIRNFLDEQTIHSPQHILQVLRTFGIKDIAKHFPQGLDTVTSADDLSFHERKILALARCMLADSSLVLLDDPVGKMKKGKAKKLIAKILESKKNCTVIATFNRPPDISCFDHIVKLRRGRVVFAGSLREWESSRSKAAEK